MCKKLTVAYGDYIGNRLVGFCCWNGKDYNFLSEKSVKAQIQQKGNLVNGLTVNEENAVVLDTTFAKCLMGKSGLSFEPIMTEDEDEPVMNKYYALVKVVRGKEGNRYEFITSRCGYEVFTEEQVKSMLSIIEMGGIKLGVDGGLVIHDAVDVEDTTGEQNKPQGPKGKGVS